ncbi:MAG: carbohydrate ABC transporter permease, partial [Pseudomonadota bacterium]
MSATSPASNAPALPRRRRIGLDGHTAFVYALLIVGATVLLIPFYWMLTNSLKTESGASLIPPTLLPLATYVEVEGQELEVALSEKDDTAGTIRVTVEAGDDHPMTGQSLVVDQADVVERVTPRWSNYPESLERMDFANALANTTIITLACVIGQVLSSSLVGFGFSRFRFRGRNFLFILMLSTMMLPPQVSMIPLFIGFRYLGMIDSFWPLILPMWLGSPFYVFMFRQFFTQVPEELVEAARIDGATNLRI